MKSHQAVSQVYIVVSHNDSDHTAGVCSLLDWLDESNQYTVEVYTHQYLKYVDVILEKIQDGRRKREPLKEALLQEFNHIKEIIERAQSYGFSALEAVNGTKVGECTMVGPTSDEFTDVAAQAVDKRVGNMIGEGDAAETVMNAASVQLKCKLDNSETVLLCGDASPEYLKNLDSYEIIQLPHHGQLDDAKAIFEKLKDPDDKTFFISDNTGSGMTSGGSVKLKEYMKNERYKAALNTQDGIIDLPPSASISRGNSRPQGVRLSDMDC